MTKTTILTYKRMCGTYATAKMLRNRGYPLFVALELLKYK